ncbi:helix-turn-helix domain-containing protein [Streptomyces sp. NPDC096012]|uniref:helix-turn-helix domain-containing protein n=1 Tax=Streptomyces sp. NPDC096012 TaxID=3155684 RepID=UPI00336AA02F
MAEKNPSAPLRSRSRIAGNNHPNRRSRTAGVVHENSRLAANFTVVGNELLQHPELSCLAIGLGAYIQSLPTGAPVDIKTLSTRFTEGAIRVARALRELEAAGYLRRDRVRTSDGRIVTVTVSRNQPGRRTRADAPAAEPQPDPHPDPQPPQRPHLPPPSPSGAGHPHLPPHAQPPTSQAHLPAHAQPPTSQAHLPAHAQPPTSQAHLPAHAQPPTSQAHLPAHAQPPAPSQPRRTSQPPGPAQSPPRPRKAPRKPLPPVPQPSCPAPKLLQLATELLADLRRRDCRLLLSETDAAHLAPGVGAWLERDLSPADVRRALTADLPTEPLVRPAALLAHRLAVGLPPLPPYRAPAPPPPVRHPLHECDGCDRPFRGPAPGRCRDCRSDLGEAA